MAFTPFSDLNEGAFFVVPNERPLRLRVKRQRGDGLAYGIAWPGDVRADEIRLRENRRDIFSCDSSLMVMEIDFEPMSN